MAYILVMQYHLGQKTDLPINLLQVEQTILAIT